MTSDFYVYLSNLNSSKKYSENTISKFTNDLIPPLLFDTANDWQVALASCIMPWAGYKSQGFYQNDTFDLLWIIKTISQDGTISSDTYKIIIHFNSFLNKSPEQIVKQIILDTENALGNSQNELFNQILNVFGGRISLNHFISKKIYTDGPFKNIMEIAVIFNENMQDLLGLDKGKYNLFEINREILHAQRYTIFGNRKIGFDLVPSNYITIYTDIISPVQYGAQNLSVLDILPFGDSELNERKLNKLFYRTVNKNVINDISILIHGSNKRLFQNYAEHTILCLHFLKKNKNEFEN